MQRDEDKAESARVTLLESHRREISLRSNKIEAQQNHRKAPLSMPWKTLVSAMGCYLLALLISISHYCFFRKLDGIDVLVVSGLRQSYVTTISLLLVTAFRASILVVLGICFTQCLWYLLRTKAMQVSLIESLFQMRTNFVNLANPRVARHAPILLVIAAISWLVPLATVYPPGALVIRSEQNSLITLVNASIMNPPPKQSSSESWPVTLADTDVGLNYHYIGGGTNLGYSRSYYLAPTFALRSVAKHVMFTGQIMSLSSLGRENSSHSLIFDGPRVRCQSLPVQNTTLVSTLEMMESKLEVLFNSSWSFLEDHQKVLTLSSSNLIGFYPVPRRINETCGPNGSCSWSNSLSSNDTITLILERHVLECDAHKTSYHVDFNYERGVQQVRYKTSESEPLLFEYDHDFVWNATSSPEVPNTTEYAQWKASVPFWRHQATVRAILDAVGLNLNYTWRGELMIDTTDNGGIGSFRLENGSEIAIGQATVSRDHRLDSYTILQDSSLNQERFNQNDSITYLYDPRNSFDITEASINELLANVSISALSLNMWYGNVTVNNTVFRNVYRFSEPLNLVLPYGLCLATTLVFVIIGLHALRLNGVPATDGGFLQIVLASTGDTAMNKAAAEGSMRAMEDAPKELLDMKVRFGRLNELSGVSSVAGFGTADETSLLDRKGWRAKE